MRCDICGKEPSFGNSICRRGMAKKKGGVGQKITGISRRLFRPNIQQVRVKVGGQVRRMRVCTKCLRGGKVLKG
jgi:large subunit ribosomal protein L28